MHRRRTAGRDTKLSDVECSVECSSKDAGKKRKMGNADTHWIHSLSR